MEGGRAVTEYASGIDQVFTSSEWFSRNSDITAYIVLRSSALALSRNFDETFVIIRLLA